MGADAFVSPTDIAVVGMACRFPGASDPESFWHNIRDAVECIRFYSPMEMEHLGVDPALIHNPAFVRAASSLSDPELFDADFFGYSPREAELMDPQHRIFLECCWEALENAGYSPGSCPKMTGIYAGSSLSSYLLYNLLPGMQGAHAENAFEVMIGNDKDFLSTRVAYKLNLWGPSLTVQTGCSSSLVALHLACQALLTYECDMALAGGVSIQVPQRAGHLYQEGGLNSPDGHCRTFDAKAGGTIFGSGAGVVVIKRLSDAWEQGGCIHGVIKGSAINNDGSRKAGYTAPSVESQRDVITMAHAVAKTSPAEIGYIECHGTATALGDSVEVLALKEAFAQKQGNEQRCALGSVKANIGHLDAAAGIAGFLKALLVLKHAVIPRMPWFEKANPSLDLESSPFYVPTEGVAWVSGAKSRRAAVSSFGIGGTNAHMILESWPHERTQHPAQVDQIICISARSAAALDAATSNLRDFLSAPNSFGLSDIAYTLQTGRKEFPFRRALVCRNKEEAAAALESFDSQMLFAGHTSGITRNVVFMFPGGGAQYVNMALGIYKSEPVFRQEVDRCVSLLGTEIRTLVRDSLYPREGAAEETSGALRRPSVGLPALFAIEYAMAKLCMSWGVDPRALIGHSLGEYTAACLSGIFRLEDTVELVALRGRLFEQLRKGAMLSVSEGEQNLIAILPAGLDIAAVNARGQCAVAGPEDIIERFSEVLREKGIDFRRILIDTASHCQMVEPILGSMRRFISGLRLQKPRIPLVSNLTGTWLQPEEATDPGYWERHLRSTVRFADGVELLATLSDCSFLEVGPGHTLSTFARMRVRPPSSVFSSIRHFYDSQPDTSFLASTVAKLWTHGVSIDWNRRHDGTKRLRCPLPTYPFERKRYWIQPPRDAATAQPRRVSGKTLDVATWFYQPSWRRRPLPAQVANNLDSRGTWLVFLDRSGLGEQCATDLEAANERVIRVQIGDGFERTGSGSYTLNPKQKSDYFAVMRDLISYGGLPAKVLHFWNLDSRQFDEIQYYGYHSLVFLIQAVDELNLPEPFDLYVIAKELFRIESRDLCEPDRSTALGPALVIPQEYPGITCRVVDIPNQPAWSPQEAARWILREARSHSQDPVIAYRGEMRWVRDFETIELPEPKDSEDRLRTHGVYFISGGLGSVGLSVAGYLARNYLAKLALFSRYAFPTHDGWDQWIVDHGSDDAVSRKIIRLQGLEDFGAEILLLRANVADEQEVAAALKATEERFGCVNGVFHLAGLAGEAALGLLRDSRVEAYTRHLEAKVHGTRCLNNVFQDRPLDFRVLFSSNASVLGGIGSAAYTSVNTFLDTFAEARAQWISVNWDAWPREGVDFVPRTSLDAYAMSEQESVTALRRILHSAPPGQVIVSTGDLHERLRIWVRAERKPDSGRAEEIRAPISRPSLANAYEAPSSPEEHVLAGIWQDLLGIDRVGVNDNFFDLGGNSLIGLKVISSVQKNIGIKLPMVTLFESPTVGRLAKAVLAASKTPEEHGSPLDSEVLGSTAAHNRVSL